MYIYTTYNTAIKHECTGVSTACQQLRPCDIPRGLRRGPRHGRDTGDGSFCRIAEREGHCVTNGCAVWHAKENDYNLLQR